MKKKDEETDLVDAWEKGTPVEVRRVRPPSSVLSMRLPSALFENLSSRAEAAGLSASQFAREVIERGLNNSAPSTPADVASMFHRWAAELTQGFRMKPSVPPGLTRTTWVTIYVPSGIVDPIVPREATVEPKDVATPTTQRAGKKVVA